RRSSSKAPSSSVVKSRSNERDVMRGLVLWAAKNAFIAILVCLGIIGAGLYAAKELAIDAVPDLTNIQVQVVTRASALSATEVESQITQPIERGMAGIPGLK